MPTEYGGWPALSTTFLKRNPNIFIYVPNGPQ